MPREGTLADDRRAAVLAVVSAEARGAVAGVALLLVVDTCAVAARVLGEADVAVAAAEKQRIEIDQRAVGFRQIGDRDELKAPGAQRGVSGSGAKGLSARGGQGLNIVSEEVTAG